MILGLLASTNRLCRLKTIMVLVRECLKKTKIHKIYCLEKRWYLLHFMPGLKLVIIPSGPILQQHNTSTNPTLIVFCKITYDWPSNNKFQNRNESKNREFIKKRFYCPKLRCFFRSLMYINPQWNYLKH